MAPIEMRSGDTDCAIEIIREVAQWCIDVGAPMWRLEELTRKALLRYPPSEADFRTVWIDGKLAAAMILQWHDPRFWPEVKPDESGFIHKLCVRRSFAGRRVAGQIVELAQLECIRRGIGWLRLDTDFNSPKLCTLYEAMGFVKVGRKMVDDRDYALYEKRPTSESREQNASLSLRTRMIVRGPDEQIL